MGLEENLSLVPFFNAEVRLLLALLFVIHNNKVLPQAAELPRYLRRRQSILSIRKVLPLFDGPQVVLIKECRPRWWVLCQLFQDLPNLVLLRIQLLEHLKRSCRDLQVSIFFYQSHQLLVHVFHILRWLPTRFEFLKDFVKPDSFVIRESLNLSIWIVIQHGKIEENVAWAKILHQHRAELKVEDVGELMVDKILHLWSF